MIELSKAEEIFLLAILNLKDNAYGVSIRDKIQEKTGKAYTFGTLYGVLDQIVRRGYAVKFEGDPVSERGGRRKLFYKLTRSGYQGLARSFDIQQSIWDGVSKASLEHGSDP